MFAFAYLPLIGTVLEIVCTCVLLLVTILRIMRVSSPCLLGYLKPCVSNTLDVVPCYFWIFPSNSISWNHACISLKPCTSNSPAGFHLAYTCDISNTFVCVCLTTHRQQGHLETAPPFTVPCEGHDAQWIHRPDRESNPGPSRGSPLRYRCATETPLIPSLFLFSNIFTFLVF